MNVNFYATLRQITGCKSAEFPLDGSVTIRRLVASLLKRYPPLREELLDERGELRPHVHVFINGRDAVYLEQGLETAIAPGDTVDVFPAVAGG